jgi:NAD+ dependent glucose-6-phosphate dehydrogenase
MKKKITIIGGAGNIGSILTKGLSDQYDITVLDKMEPTQSGNFTKVDATNYDQLIQGIPKDSDALINLLTVTLNDDLKNIEHFQKMINIHLISSFYILRAAIELGINKVVYASSNHTTDYYEHEGHSSLGREISIKDYPFSVSLYGVLKLASENIGHILAHEKENKLSVINLRIGSVPKDEFEALSKKGRLFRTLLSREDTIQLFDLALRSTVKYGTYYGVSDNPGKPWSTENAWRELGYVSEISTTDILEN